MLAEWTSRRAFSSGRNSLTWPSGCRKAFKPSKAEAPVPSFGSQVENGGGGAPRFGWPVSSLREALRTVVQGDGADGDLDLRALDPFLLTPGAVAPGEAHIAVRLGQAESELLRRRSTWCKVRISSG